MAASVLHERGVKRESCVGAVLELSRSVSVQRDSA